MILKPSTLKPRLRSANEMATVSVYPEAVRFSKAAIALLGKVNHVAFDLRQDGTIALIPDAEGFHIELRSHANYTINSRELCYEIRKKLNASSRLVLKLEKQAEEFVASAHILE